MIWEIIVAVSTAFSALVILITAIFAVWQLNEMRKSRQLDAYINIVQILQNEEIRGARRTLISKLTKKDFEEWTEEDRNQAEKVCHTYDTVGMMSLEKHIDSKLVTAGWHYSITTCWEACCPMIKEYRKTRGEDYWDNFEKLNKMAQQYEQKMEAN